MRGLLHRHCPMPPQVLFHPQIVRGGGKGRPGHVCCLSHPGQAGVISALPLLHSAYFIRCTLFLLSHARTHTLSADRPGRLLQTERGTHNQRKWLCEDLVFLCTILSALFVISSLSILLSWKVFLGNVLLCISRVTVRDHQYALVKGRVNGKSERLR